jgi:hypothetical protein
LRERHAISESEIVIGCFGFIGPTKRMDKVCQALSLIKNELSFKLLIVGEGGDLTSVIRDNDLEDRTIQTRFVSKDEFSNYLHLTDVVVNLRFPSMGESSATLIQALMLAKPCIVTNDALFGDLPDECVIKIDVGDSEVTDLSRALIDLAKDASRRSSLGNTAMQFVESHWSGSRIAEKLRTAIEIDIKIRAQESLKKAARDLADSGLASNLIWERMTSCVPPHLQRTVPGPETWRDGDADRLSEEEIRWAYRLFLDREPESAAVIEEMATRFRHRADLREALLHSEEYIRKSGDDFFK